MNGELLKVLSNLLSSFLPSIHMLIQVFHRVWKTLQALPLPLLTVLSSWYSEWTLVRPP